MAGKEIRISIMSALNAAGIEATKEQVARMADSVGKSMSKAAADNRHHWADIKAAWDMGVGAIKKIASAAASVLKSAFHFETQTTQFKTLIGNIDDARAHMADLKELGDTPPFSLDEFAKASRSLMVMTQGALGYKDSLQLIGDAAAATGQPIEEMGQVVGRLYALIRDGEPVGRAALQLQNMGVITPEVTEKLKDMQKAERSNAEIWAVVEEQLGRYSGAMKETEQTGEGLMGAIKSKWDNIVRAFGQALQGTAKDGMGKILDAAKDLEENGTLEVWASKVGEAVSKVVEAIGVAVKMAGKLADAFHWVQDKSAQVGAAVGGFVGTLMGGGTLSEAAGSVGKSWEEEGRLRADMRKDEAQKEEEIKKAVVRRVAEEKAKREIEAEKKVAARSEAERTRIQESLAKAQVKIDEKLAKEHEKVQTKDVFESRISALDERIERYKAQLKKVEEERNRSERGREADARHKTGIFGPYNYGGRANGGEDFTDWQRAQRFAERADRDAEKAARRDARAQSRYDRIMDDLVKGKKVSDADRKFSDDFKKFQDQKDNAKNMRDALEAAQKERDSLQKEMHKTLKDIDKNIKSALGVG